MATQIDYKHYYEMDSNRATESFCEDIDSRMMEMKIDARNYTSLHNLTGQHIENLFGIPKETFARSTIPLAIDPSKLPLLCTAIYPDKSIDEGVWGIKHPMKLPNLAAFVLSCYSSCAQKEKDIIKLTLNVQIATYQSFGDRIAAYFEDEVKSSYLEPSFRTWKNINILNKWIKQGVSDMNVRSIRPFLRIVVGLNLSLDYLFTQDCGNVDFYWDRDLSGKQQPLTNEERDLLKLFFPLSDRDKIKVCSQIACLALKS